MLTNFLIVAHQVVILFVLIGAGVCCRRARLIDAASVRGMVNLLILVVTPAIVIDSFQRPYDPRMLRQLGLAFVVASAAHLVAIALALLTVRGDERTQPVLRVATVFSNAGFMGLPLEYAILGPPGVFYGIVYVAMFNVFMWSWGLMQMKNGKGRALPGAAEAAVESAGMKILFNPGTLGLAIGLPLFVCSITLPKLIGRPIHMLSELNTPLAMLVIGYYLGGANLRSLVRNGAVHLAALMRLVVLPLVVLGGLYLARSYLDRSMVIAMVTASGAPAAAMVTMFAAKFNRDVDMSVGLVSGTTILSVITMPAIIALAMSIMG